MLCQFLLDAVHHLQRHPMAFPQFWLAVRAVQHKHGLTICRDDVDMGGAVIVHIDSHTQAIEAKNGWHWWEYNLNAWVFQGVTVGVKYIPLFLVTFTPFFAERNARNCYVGTASVMVIVPIIMSISARIFRMRS